MPQQAKVDFSLLKNFNETSKSQQRLSLELNKLLLESRNGDKTLKTQNLVNKKTRLYLKAVKESEMQDKLIGILFNAAADGKVGILQQAFDQGISIDFLNRGGSTLLSYAAAGDQEKAVDFLLARKADINLAGKYGFPPLKQAALKDNGVIFKKLLTAGADRKGIESVIRGREADNIRKVLKDKTFMGSLGKK
jgi:ankyrin repeat protein